VSFTVADHYDSEDFEDNDGDMVAGPYDFKVAEGVNAADYFGIASTVFVKEYAKSKYEIIAIMPNANNTTVELGIEDIENVTDAGISYYTSESKYDSELLKFEANSAAVDFYYNNNKEAAGDYTSITDYIDQNEDIEIVAHDTNDNNRFDTVIVKKYEYARVQYVEADRDNFTAGGETFKFDFDNDTPVTMVDKNGDAITLADFEKDDVIAYIVENDSFAADKWKEIINLGKNTVTGTVGEVKADAVYIDGTEYGFKGAQPSLGDEGTFYLTRTGKIFNFEVSASITGNYAYILGVAHTDANGFSKEWQVKMLTKDNEIVTYAVKDGADIFGVTINKDTTYNSAGTLNDLRVATSDAVAINDPAYVTRRIVTYELNSKGLISEINAVATTEFGDADSNSAASQAEYEKDAQYLGTDLEDDTVIFNITSDNENSVFATTLDTLVDENKYGGYYVTHVVNGTTEADCLVVTYGGSKIDVEQDLAIITNVTTTTIGDNEKAKKITYVTANDDTAKVITIAEDDDVSKPEWGTSYENDINVGAAMMFTDDGNGTAAAYGVVIRMATSDGNAIAGAVGAINTTAQAVIEGADKNLTFIDGYIESYDSGNNGMVIKAVKSDGTPLANVVIKAETNRYTFVNESANRQRVHAADWKAGNVAKADEDNDTANYFIAIKSRSTVKDIIVYSEQQSVGYDVQH
ncbi:MAG: hypothetical protein IKV73_03445, partial [Clostridia bacterium]|nr:hypothetical protein [Clostridia bacterium]